jgi:hypothetical protein
MRMLMSATVLAGCLRRLDAQLLNPAGWRPASRPSWLRMSPRRSIFGRLEASPVAVSRSTLQFTRSRVE